MSGDYTLSAQCLQAANKAYQAQFHLRLTVPPYGTNMKPLLEYCCHRWSPYLQKDQLVPDKAQKTFSKMVTGVMYPSYKKRLSKLELFSLEHRGRSKRRGDLLEVFKALNGGSSVELRNLFRVQTDSMLRVNPLTLGKPRSNTSIRLQFFSKRMIIA